MPADSLTRLPATDSSPGSVTILTSGVGLGVHVPGLLLRDRLRSSGVPAECLPIEQIFTQAWRSRISGSKLPLHRRPRVALAAQRLVQNQEARVDAEAWAEVRRNWLGRPGHRVVVLSGYWLPLLDEFLEGAGVAPTLDILHLDSVLSPSFQFSADSYGRLRARSRSVWFPQRTVNRVVHTIAMPTEPPVLWTQRSSRVLAHGGGWGTGTYRERAEQIRQRSGLALSMVVHEESDIDRDADIHYYLLDPHWNPWEDDGYPPLGRVRRDGTLQWLPRTGPHASYRLAQRCQAMISKPGGGTLLDSFTSATPLILAEPVGEHERDNLALWLECGFGVHAETWLADGCPLDALRECHERIREAQPRAIDYCATILPT